MVTMVVRYHGATSASKSMPGEGHQVTLLGLLLFIVLINDVGFEKKSNKTGDLITSRRNLRAANQIHLKLDDDLTIAESILLKDSVQSVQDRPLPDNYHARTGHSLIPERSSGHREVKSIHEYAEANAMKINLKKTKLNQKTLTSCQMWTWKDVKSSW